MVADDRGQLILVGAIAIALVLLGLVLIVNTALFTQVVGSEGTVETAKDGGLSGQAIGDAIGDVVATENRADDSVSIINSSVSTAVGNGLQPAFSNRTFESGGSFASMQYLGYTEVGTRTAQDGPNPYTANNGDTDWDPINGTESATVESVFLTVYTNVSTLSGTTPFELSIGSGTTMSMTLQRTGTGDVQIAVTGPSSTSCTVEPTGNTIRIDVTKGRVYEDGDCTFDTFERLSSPDTVRFSNGDEVEGTYEIVSEDVPILPSLDPRFADSDPDRPSRGDAILAFEYAFTYDSTAATAESVSREVEVYD